MPTDNINHQITLEEAVDYTSAYRAANPNGVLAFTLPAGIYKDILNQEGCAHIRTYNALDENGQPQIVIVGVDADGKDMYNGILGDRTYRNPPFSGGASPLNS